jgi:hypothetical protein
MLARHGASDDWGMLVGFTRYLASLPDFWWGSFPALLVPHWFWKAIARSSITSRLKAGLGR